MKKFRLALLYMLSFVVSIAPLAVHFTMNYDRYIGTKAEGIKLLFGGGMVLAILLLKALKKLKIPSGVWFFGIMFMLSYLLETVLIDLKLLSLLALAGEGMDLIVQAFISKEKQRLINRQAASVVENAMEKCINGRV